MNSTVSMQHLQRLQEKAVLLEDAIKRIVAVQQQLKENATEVKGQIQSAISRQLESLRSREIWLLNQVEIIQQAKEDVLLRQQAVMQQALGGVISSLETQDWTQMEGYLNRTLEKLEILEMKPEDNPFMSFNANTASLREVIHKFGGVSGQCPLMERPFVEQAEGATSLPKWFEDYEDVEHHVLYKSVQTDPTVTVRIPRLLHGNDSKWLHRPSTVSSHASSSTSVGGSTITTEGLFPAFQEAKTSSVTKWLLNPGSAESTMESLPRESTAASIRQWLCQIKDETEEEEEHFDVVPKAPFEAGVSGTTPYFQGVISAPLAEWLHPQRCSMNSNQEHILSYFRQTKDDTKQWLASYENQQEKVTDKVHAVCYSDNCVIDIEDVVDLMGEQFTVTADTAKWLYRPCVKTGEKEEVEERSFVLPSVKVVCKADRKCESFLECVCDENCLGSASPNNLPDSLKAWLFHPNAQLTVPSSGGGFFGWMSRDPAYWLKGGQEGGKGEIECPVFLSYFKNVSKDPKDWLKDLQTPNEELDISTDITSPDFIPTPASAELDKWFKKRPIVEEDDFSPEFELWRKFQSSIPDEKWVNLHNREVHDENQSSELEYLKKYQTSLHEEDWLQKSNNDYVLVGVEEDNPNDLIPQDVDDPEKWLFRPAYPLGIDPQGSNNMMESSPMSKPCPDLDFWLYTY